ARSWPKRTSTIPRFASCFQTSSSWPSWTGIPKRDRPRSLVPRAFPTSCSRIQPETSSACVKATSPPRNSSHWSNRPWPKPSPLLDHVLDGHPARDHRQHMLLIRYLHIEHKGAVVGDHLE